ncbi:unnamed protein product [Rhizophagus irregularis]|nr:unnamed protein product [Rhizophagus irregularis]
MINNEIDCLFVCETNIVDPNLSSTLKTAWQKIPAPPDNNSFCNEFYFTHNPDPAHRGSGCTFIMTQSLHRHLQTTKILEKGRLTKLSFNFKNKKTFNIYGIYLPSLSGNAVDNSKTLKFNNICKVLFDDIITTRSSSHNYSAILGDFNINYEKKIKNNNKSISYNEAIQKINHNQLKPWMCYHILKLLNFSNVAANFNKESEATWFSSVAGSTTTTTIDYIWASQNLNDIITSFHISKPTYSSDHAVILFSTEHPNNFFFDERSFSRSRDSNMKNNIRYNINSISKEEWETFQTLITNKIKDSYPNNSIDQYPNINQEMKQLVTIIKTTLDQMNIKKLKSTPKRNNLPLHLRQKFNQMHQLHSLLAILKNGLFLYSEDFDKEISSTSAQRQILINNFNHHWRRKSNWVIKLFAIYNIRHSLSIFNDILNDTSDIESACFHVKNLISHIDKELTKERSAWDKQQIEYFINRRNDDIKSNQKRALNSILERNREKLFLTD